MSTTVPDHAVQPMSLSEVLVFVAAFFLLVAVQGIAHGVLEEHEGKHKNSNRAPQKSTVCLQHSGSVENQVSNMEPEGICERPLLEKHITADNQIKNLEPDFVSEPLLLEETESSTTCVRSTKAAENQIKNMEPDIASGPALLEETGDIIHEQASESFFVPSHRIMQLFPDVSHVDSVGMLLNAGVWRPDDPVSEGNMDEGTRAAIQGVVDSLVQKYYPDHGEPEEAKVECPCCFQDVEIEAMVSCRDEGHIYCYDCVQRYAEEKVFGLASLGTDKNTNEPATELLCFAEGCTSCFRQNHLEKALPPKVLERYGELQGNLNVAKANLEDLCSCPKCGYRAVLLQTEKIFHCPADDGGCGHQSCRECGEDAHHPLSCQEFANKKTEKSRHKMEEAMTAALLRTCPNPTCGKPMVKDGGCNKLTCACGWLMCNVCKNKIDGYGHFCQVFDCDHKSCGKCSLWKSTHKDDKRAINEARRKGQHEVRKLERTAALRTKDKLIGKEVAVRAPAIAAAVQQQPKRHKGLLRRFRLNGKRNVEV